MSPNDDGSLPDVSWLKDGVPLSAGDHIDPFKLPDGVIGLKFSKAELPDVAQYTAVLTNPDGNKAESSAPVEVARELISIERQLRRPLQIPQASALTSAKQVENIWICKLRTTNLLRRSFAGITTLSESE